MRRHLERAELDQPEPPRGGVGREQLVDAELGSVGIARPVDQQVAKNAVDNPWRRRGPVLDLRHRNLELVASVAAAFVDAGRLARRTDERA